MYKDECTSPCVDMCEECNEDCFYYDGGERMVLKVEVVDECANMLLKHVGENYAFVVLHMPEGKPEELLISGNVTPYGVKTVLEAFFEKGRYHGCDI